MPLCRAAYLAVIVLLALTVLPNSFALAGDTITVQLASGRQLTAEVDPKTDNATLWLRFTAAGATLLRPVDWSAVESIDADGEPVVQADVLAGIETDAAETADDDLADGVITIRNESPAVRYTQQSAEPIAHRSQATHIDFYTTLSNWDNDPQPDGLLLHLSLLDANFRPVAAAGSLQAELFAPLQRRFNAVPHGRGTSVLPLARWSEAVQAGDFRDGKAVIRLPFRAAKLTATELAASYGLVHVKFAVPGHGAFEASSDGVRIRPFTPTRDLLERQDRRRVLFTEPPRREGNLR